MNEKKKEEKKTVKTEDCIEPKILEVLKKL